MICLEDQVVIFISIRKKNMVKIEQTGNQLFLQLEDLEKIKDLVELEE